jgi:hypothetical protein
LNVFLHLFKFFGSGNVEAIAWSNYPERPTFECLGTVMK